MEYDKLYKILPSEPHKWNYEQVGQWLNFIGYPRMNTLFKQAKVDGSCLEILIDQDFDDIGIKSQVVKKKLKQWIQIGLPEYKQYLKFQKLCVKPSSLVDSVDFSQQQRQPLNNLSQSNTNYNSKLLDEQVQQQDLHQKEYHTSSFNPRISGTNHLTPQINTLDTQPQGLQTLENQQSIKANLFGLEQSFKPTNIENVSQKSQRRNKIFDSRTEINSPQKVLAKSNRYQDEDENLPQFGGFRGSQVLLQNQNQISKQLLFTEEKKSERKPIFRQQIQIQKIISPEQSLINEIPIYIDNFPFSIGRGAENSIQINTSQVSRNHVVITYNNGTYFIQDKGSQSGTYIYLRGKTVLKEGYILQMGFYDYIVKNLQVQEQKCQFQLVSECGVFNFNLILNQPGSIFGSYGTPQLMHDMLLANDHALFSHQNSELIVEDLKTESGTWIRLSQQNQESLGFPIRSDRILKIANHVFKINLL